LQIAIDTSTDYASLALVQGTEILAEMTWRCGLNHSVETFPRLLSLLERSRLDIQSADCIIVAKGPGSFNGLRVGVSAAKGLAFSLCIPIVAIGTLEAAAYQHAETGLPVCAIQNAGREEIAVAVYQKKRTRWCQLSAEHISTIEALPDILKDKTIFCGEISPLNATRLKKLFKNLAVISTPAGQIRRAAYLAELGQQRIKDGNFENVATLQPLYLRRPPITQPKKPF
jgi:tRNA threonylcarbamoyl adenosine modification protein YeaZ